MPKCPPNLDAESKRIWTRLIDIMQDEGRRNHGKRGVACSGGVAEWMTWRRRASFSRPPSEFRSPAMRHPARSPADYPAATQLSGLRDRGRDALLATRTAWVPAYERRDTGGPLQQVGRVWSRTNARVSTLTCSSMSINCSISVR
jgi:hypothetical protein